MKITRKKLRQIIKESMSLNEQAGGSIEFDAVFKWDDYNDSGEPGEERETLFIEDEDLFEYGDDGAHGLALWWDGTNLDGGFAVDDVEISAGDIERVSAWMEETYQNAGY